MLAEAYLILVGVGTVPSVRVDELRAGDVIVWDHGNRTPVVAVDWAGGRALALTLGGAMGTRFTRVKQGPSPVAAMRHGRWLGGTRRARMACHVAAAARDGGWCSATVDDAGRCARGHYPPSDLIALEYPDP